MGIPISHSLTHSLTPHCIPAVSLLPSLSFLPLFLFLALPMSRLLNDAVFTLPAEFLTADDLLMDKENIRSGFSPKLHFPAEFPYEFDSPDGYSEIESSDDGRFTHLLPQETQKVAVPSFTSEKQMKSWAGACSPQSTLNGIGNWSCCSSKSSNGGPKCHSQVSSPRTTPFSGGSDSWDIIYAVAAEVARMKMYCQGPNSDYLQSSVRNPNPTFPPKKPTTGFYSKQTFNQYEYVKQWYSPEMQNRGTSMEYEMARCGRPVNLSHSAWLPLQVQRQNQGDRQACSGSNSNFVGGSSVKRESTGTGVFIPRKYGYPSDQRKETGCSPVFLPAKVVQALNLNFDGVNAQSQGDRDALMPRRNAINHEIVLPQEWTY